MNIFLAGASGVIGAKLLPGLLSAGHAVTALTRSARGAEDLRAQGARAVVGDALDREQVLALVTAARPEVVVHELTAIPARIAPRRAGQILAPTARLRREGTQNLIEAARAAGARRFVAQSIAFAYAPTGSSPHGEDDALFLDGHPSFVDIHRAVHELEQITTTTEGIKGVALRYGSFYGPGTVYDRGGAFYEDVRRRRVPVLGDGTGVFSFLHVADAATATICAIEGAATGIFNVVDDDPAPVRTWLPYYAELLGAGPPWRLPRLLGRLGGGAYAIYLLCEQRGALNGRCKQAFRWTPRRASWREGFRELLERRTV